MANRKTFGLMLEPNPILLEKLTTLLHPNEVSKYEQAKAFKGIKNAKKEGLGEVPNFEWPRPTVPAVITVVQEGGFVAGEFFKQFWLKILIQS